MEQMPPDDIEMLMMDFAGTDPGEPMELAPLVIRTIIAGNLGCILPRVPAMIVWTGRPRG